jgi:DNA-binding IclR family transcriptional regulator
VGVLDRSVAILDAVERGARTLTRITEATGLTPSTAHRIV